jgi:hypothetical protein
LISAVKQSKLVLVEGVPGSGKTTMAEFVHRWLERNGIRSRLYPEGSLDHPADYESVAFFTPSEYAALLHAHFHQRERLARHSARADGGLFVRYAEMVEAEPGTVPDALIGELAGRDVYELDYPTHVRLIGERWRRFVERARGGDEVYVFECCFLQNPLTVAQLKYNLPHPEGLRYVQMLVDLVRPLDPLLIYLSQGDVRGALARVASERPQHWREGVGAYTDRGAWAQATGHTGFEGFVTWLEVRQSVELPFVAGSGMAHLVVDVTGQEWDTYQRQVAAFLQEMLID